MKKENKVLKEDLQNPNKTNIEKEEAIGKNTKFNKIKNNKTKIILLVCLSIIIILAILFSTIFALINMNSNKIISGVKINGIEIKNLSREEATQKLNEIVNQKLDKDIKVKADDFEYEIKLSQIEADYNIQKAMEEAYNIGRDGNIFSNNYQIIKTMLYGKDINLDYTFNEELLNKIIDDINSKIPNPVVEVSYNIEDDKLIINKGQTGNTIDKEQLKSEITNEILINNENTELNIDLIKQEPKPINIDEIYSKVHTEPKDAYYTKNPFKIYPHVNGVDFDLEVAKEMLKKDKDEYEIKLTITTPKITTNKIGTEAFPDLLSSFTTKYDASNYPRTTNLKLAMKKLNGVIVASGETFSYNKTLGKRTVEEGYREAGGYAGGKVVQTLAGGICQISSTLYDAVVYANLDIVERHNHMFLAGYVGAGKDATVVYGSLDFKFKNTRKYPIMIKTTIGSGVAKIDIYGIKEDVEYDVDIVTNILSYTPFKVIYENDSSLAEGKQRVSQYGMNGCKSITYKVLKLNGAEVSRTVLSSDSYDPMNKIVNVGPKKAASTNNTSNKKTETKTETTKNKTTTEKESTKKESTEKTENKKTETNKNNNNDTKETQEEKKTNN